MKIIDNNERALSFWVKNYPVGIQYEWAYLGLNAKGEVSQKIWHND